MYKFLSYLYLFSWVILVRADNPCNLRQTENGSICVCDSSYCDTVPNIQDLKFNQYQLYSTSKAKLGFYSTTGTFSNPSTEASATVTIGDLSSTHQSIIGFGGAFTDATGINIARLPEAAQELLLQSYFGEDGIQYSLGRVPIGGTDFSTRPYTYDDGEIDETLENFALQPEDITFKIPYIQRAKKLRGDNGFKLFGSAWSAPIWMKTNNWYNDVGTLKDEYWPLWAEYYVKFFDAYQQNDITFWGVTTQNEPTNGLSGQAVPNVGFNSSQMRGWISKYLGPAIRNSSHADVKIILHDDQRFLLPILKWFVLADDEVLKYSDGVGVHWYTDAVIPPIILNFAKSDKKDLFCLSTEACTGFAVLTDGNKAVDLGSWDRAEQYLNSIIDDLNYDVGGWTDWNMALNETGGPNWIGFGADSPIIINGTSGEFYKQPMFYALGHFSKFLVPDSVRIDVAESGISSVAFKRPDGKLAVILRNKFDNDVSVKVDILGSTEVFTIDQHSINTLIYSL